MLHGLHGASAGDRTQALALKGRCSTLELQRLSDPNKHCLHQCVFINLVRAVGFEPTILRVRAGSSRQLCYARLVVDHRFELCPVRYQQTARPSELIDRYFPHFLPCFVLCFRDLNRIPQKPQSSLRTTPVPSLPSRTIARFTCCSPLNAPGCSTRLNYLASCITKHAVAGFEPATSGMYSPGALPG